MMEFDLIVIARGEVYILEAHTAPYPNTECIIESFLPVGDIALLLHLEGVVFAAHC